MEKMVPEHEMILCIRWSTQNELQNHVTGWDNMYLLFKECCCLLWPSFSFSKIFNSKTIPKYFCQSSKLEQISAIDFPSKISDN